MKLLSHNFFIAYKLSKINLVNTLFKQSDYHTENIATN